MRESNLLGFWRPIFQIDGAWVDGIQWATGMGISGEGNDLHEQYVNIVRIDLDTPGIQFFTTPKNELRASGWTIFEFLTGDNTPLSTVLAINGALAAGLNGQTYLFGAAKSLGNVVCDPTQPAEPGGEPDVRNGADAGTAALTITSDLQNAWIGDINAQTGLPANWNDLYTVVAGSPNVPPGTVPPQPFYPDLLLPGQSRVLVGGANQGLQQRTINPGGDDVWIAGRTAVGLSSDQRTLFLLTVDGIENPPNYGATFYDVGEWLLRAGAWDGFTLDGGGSTAMAMMAQQVDSDQSTYFIPVLMNVPHGSESLPYLMRRNAQFFGVTVPGVITSATQVRPC